MWWPTQTPETQARFKALVRNGQVWIRKLLLKNLNTRFLYEWFASNLPVLMSAAIQLEFVGAGWSQSDEVSPSYRDMIDNTVTGHEFLRRTLGDACPNDRCVRFGWQIDMFSGYSGTTPLLWALMGYDGMVIRFEVGIAPMTDWVD